MATEEGVVIRTGSGTAWVKTVRSDACKACSARGSCNAMGGGGEMEVEVVNAVGAGTGDRVVLRFETSPLLKATFLLYVVPVMVLLAGALIGNALGAAAGWNLSAASAVFGFLAFFASIFFIRRRANRLGQMTDYQPKITRILGHADPTPDDC